MHAYLIKFSSHVQELDLWRLAINGIQADERVDLEVSKVQVGVDVVKGDEKVDEGFVLCGWDVLEQCACNGRTRRQLATDGDEQLEGFSIDIANFDTTFMREEDDIAFTDRVDANVELGVGRMRLERLYDKGVDGASDAVDLRNNSARG